MGTAFWLTVCSALAGSTPDGGSALTMTLSSPAFRAGAEIPPQYTCDGKNISPPLEWSGVPDGARSLALILDDPDAPDPKAPKTVYTHWVLYNLPTTTTRLPEAAMRGDLPKGTREGVNDFRRPGYGGPCPPIGRHRYFFKLFAVDQLLPDLKSPTRADLERALEGHVLARAELIGTYQRNKSAP